MKKIKSFNSFINENYKVNNITEQDIIDCVKAGGVIYSDIVSEYTHNDNWEKEPLTPYDVEDGRVGVKIDGNPHYVNIEDVKRVEWNPERRISELFDSEELRDMQEIEFMKGIDTKKLSATAMPKLTPVQNLVYRLDMDVPFVADLETLVSDKEVLLKKEETLKFSENDIVSFRLEAFISVNRIDDYTMSYKIETIGNGQSMFKRIEHFGIMDYKKLLEVINSTFIDDIVAWNKESEQIFKKTPMPNLSKRYMAFNPKNN